jgi:hypothetical protein
VLRMFLTRACRRTAMTRLRLIFLPSILVYHRTYMSTELISLQNQREPLCQACSREMGET